MTFKPTLIPTLITVPCFIFLMILGSWQLYRLIWKTELIAKVESQMAQPPVTLPKNNNLTDMQYRRFSIKGQFLDAPNIHLYTGPLTPKGKPGYNIIGKFISEDGRIFAVDKGWILASKKSAHLKGPTTPTTTIEVMLLPPEKAGWFTPDNDLINNLWFWLDIQAIRQAFGPQVEPVILRQINHNHTEQYPVPGKAEIVIRNDHLQYSLTWYSLAFFLLVIYVVYHKKAK